MPEQKITEEEALQFHARGRPGKIELAPTKPLTTQRDLSLAYSPGVAAPCLRIAEDPASAYDYTARGNMVAVISNGTAVLGLGNIGALASKPVMEGKAVLFKRFADVDSIDLEVSTEDVDEFVNCVRFLGPSFGGINLEDIKAPECFIIEQRLREEMDIPVFHDDQHGTAIIAAAGLINALQLTGRDIKKTKLVVNGAGAASIACTDLIKAMSMPSDNVILCDSKGALDVRASTINDEMKIAAAQAIAELAREDVPDEVANAYGGRSLQYGPDYIIPVPFDPRLIVAVPAAVAEAAMRSGVARRPIMDMEGYRQELKARLDPTANMLQLISERVRQNPRRVCFAEGEDPRVIRAAALYSASGYGTPVLVGREERIQETTKELGLDGDQPFEIHNARISSDNTRYMDLLYERLQRKGYLHRDCQRLVNQDRNVFAACMLAKGDVDAVVTGATRAFNIAYDGIRLVIDQAEGSIPLGLTIMVARGRTIFIADTSVHELPEGRTIAEVAKAAATYARRLGHEPRVAMLYASSFGNPDRPGSRRPRDAVSILEAEDVDFEFDGEMSPTVALDHELMRRLYPFCKLSGPANVLVMPGINSAHIATRMLKSLGGGTMIGPLLVDLERPVQIAQMGATVSDLVSVAALAAHEAID